MKLQARIQDYDELLDVGEPQENLSGCIREILKEYNMDDGPAPVISVVGISNGVVTAQRGWQVDVYILKWIASDD